MFTYIIIIGILVVAVVVACFISPTVRKYAKWIAGGVIALGGVILAIATFRKKDTKIPADQARITAAEARITQDIANIAKTDAEIKASQDAAKKLADKAKQDIKAQEAKPAPTGSDQGKAGDDFNNALNK